MEVPESVKVAALQGTFGGCVTYGILLLLYYLCMRLLIFVKDKDYRVWLQMAYCTALFICATVGAASYMNFVETQIFAPSEPGPLISSLPPVCFGTFMITMWLADGVLLYRFFFIWGWNLSLLAFPFIMYISTIILASIGFGILVHPNPSIEWKHLWSSAWAISAGFNVILSAAIAGRLLHLNRRIRRRTGHPTSNIYTTFTSLIIEAAAFTTIPAFAIFVICAKAPPFVPKVMPSFGNFAALSPILIQYWVAKNRAVSPRVICSMTHAAFGPRTDAKVPEFVDICRQTTVHHSQDSTSGSLKEVPFDTV